MINNGKIHLKSIIGEYEFRIWIPDQMITDHYFPKAIADTIVKYLNIQPLNNTNENTVNRVKNKRSWVAQSWRHGHTQNRWHHYSFCIPIGTDQRCQWIVEICFDNVYFNISVFINQIRTWKIILLIFQQWNQVLRKRFGLRNTIWRKVCFLYWLFYVIEKSLQKKEILLSTLRICH